MKYCKVCPAVFLERPNRFIALCQLNGETVKAHVKNTGRCRELLVPGAAVILEESENPSRKTRYSLIAVWKGAMLVNMDSQAPNKVLGEAMRQGFQLPGMTEPVQLLQGEKTYGDSRLDFYGETAAEKLWIEVKGVTLEENGCALFPDAPTSRGERHIRELIRAAKEGFAAYIVFVIQMQGVKSFSPNRRTHPAFAEALLEADRAGVHIAAYDCRVAPGEIRLDASVPIRL